MTLQGLKSKIEKNKILFVIIISYIVIISLFVSAFFTIYFYSQDTFRSYFDYNSNIIADNISEKYEENVEHINTMVVNSILTSTEIKDNIQAIQSGEDSLENYWDVRYQLERTLYDTDYLTEALIYVENRDLIIFSNGFCSTQQYYNAYASDNFKDYAEFLSFLSGEQVNENLYSPETKQLFSRRQYYLYKENIEIGKIILKNDMEGFLQSFTDETSDVVIFENEYVIASSDEKIASEIIASEYINNDMFELNGKLVYRSLMGDGRKKCFYVVDMGAMNDSKKTYSIFIFGICMICLLICAAACTFFVRLHYKPIKRFVDFIRTKNKDKDNNGYKIFSNAVDYIETNEKIALNELEVKERSLREIHLEQWLLYKKDSFGSLMKSEKGEKSALIVIKAEDYEQIFFDQVYEKLPVKLEMANCILDNIFDEEFGKCFSDTVKCKINNLLVWLVSLDGNGDFRENVNRIADKMLTLVKKEFNISFEHYTSEPRKEGKKLLEDFDLIMVGIKKENEEVISGALSSGENADKGFYYFPETLKKQLYDNIEEGNTKGAITIIDNLLSYNTQVMEYDINNLKALATEIYNTIIFRLGNYDVQIERIFEENRLGKDIIMCEQIEMLEAELKKFIDSMCSIFYSRVNSNDSVYSKTRRFIYQNYKDPLLSSVIIADELGLSRDYFLSVFKKESGIKVADYIHQIRIEEACKLLGKTNSSVEKVAKQVGYSNTKTFSRVFVKLKGVTPGAYRDQLG